MQPSFGPATRSFTTRLEGKDFGASAEFAAVGDFNNDGIPDLAVDGDFLLIYLGTGSGSYLPPAALPYFDARAIAIGDFNADGNSDLAVGASGGLVILLGDGKGHFPADQNPIGNGAERIAVGDFDGDGILDLATADYHGNVLKLYKGAGDGSFSLSHTVLVGSGANTFYDLFPRSGDLNGDGIDDLAVASAADAQIGILLGRRDGVLTPSYVPLPGATAGDLRIGDFDGDGILDLVAVSLPALGSVGSLVVLLGAGDGGFHVQSSLEIGSSFVFDTGEFNGDSKLDVALVRTYGPDGLYDGGLFILPGTGQGAFSGPIKTQIRETGPPMLAVADLNLDGKVDVVIPDATGETVTVMLGKGDGYFEDTPRFSAGVGILRGIVAADFNNDGLPDVAVSGTGYDHLAVLLGKGAGGFGPPQVVDSFTFVDSGLVAADFNRDGKMDIVVSDSFGLFVFPGVGDGNLGSPIQTPTESGLAMAATDFDNDSNPDILMRMVGKIVLYRGKGDGTFHAPSTVSTLSASTFAVGDVNGDGKVDFALSVSTSSATTLYVYLGVGDGTFLPPIASALDEFVNAMALGDMDQDGKIDVVVVYPYRHAVGVLLGDGTGVFASPLRTETNGYYGTVVLADVTGDGLLDAVITSQYNVAVLTGIDGGHLGPARIFTIPGTPVEAVVRDFDGDAKPDIAVAGNGSIYTPPDFVALLTNTSCEPRRIALTTDVSRCTASGTTFPVEPVLRILDDGDNPVVCANGSVSATIVPGSGTPGAVLGGVTSVPLVNGTATFTNLSIDSNGTGYILEFSHATAGVTQSRPFTVGSAPPVSIGGPSSLCSAGTYSATPGFDTYVWSVDEAFVGTRSPIVLNGHLLGKGSHTLQVTASKNGCETASPSFSIQVPLPDATVTAPASVCPYATDAFASVPEAGKGAMYDWRVTNGVITSGFGTHSIQFRSGPAGTVVLSVTVSNSQACSEVGSKTVFIDPAGCPPSIGFFTVVPCRVVDTRDPAGVYGGPALTPGRARAFVLAGQCGIPDDARAVAVNVTVTQPTDLGHLTVSPGGSPPPAVSTLNYRSGQTRANNAIAALGAAGDVVISCTQLAGSTQVLVDVAGYFR